MYVLHIIIQCLKKYFNLCYFLKVNYTYEIILMDIYVFNIMLERHVFQDEK